MRGRKPTAFVAGTTEAIPRPPTWLSPEAKAEWKRIMPDLVRRRVLDTADLGMVEAYCVATGRVRQIERVLQKSGDELDLKLVRAQDKAMVTARQIAAEIGATPVSRSRPSIREEETDELDFLG